MPLINQAKTTISDYLFQHIEHLQEKADKSIDLYPEHIALMPNDAVYLTRVSSIKSVCSLIESLCEKSGLDFKEVITKSIAPNKKLIAETYIFSAAAIDVLIKDFGLK